MTESREAPPTSGGTRRAAAGAALFAAAAAVYVGMRLAGLTEYSLWGDEVFSLRVARMPLRMLLDAAAADAVHPPLFYLLLKAWVSAGGEALWWLRLFPVATSVAALVPFALLCREARLGRAESAVALALVAVNPYLIHYAQELRMYSLLLFCSLLSLWAFLRFLEPEGPARGRLAALFAANLLLVYTHYFGWLVVGTEAAVLLFARPRRAPAFGAAAAGLLAAFAPWAWAVWRASGGQRGLDQRFRERPALADLAAWFGSLDGATAAWWATLAGIAVFCLPMVVLAWRALAGRDGAATRTRGLALLGAAAFLPVAAAFAASHLLAESVWRDRYLIVSAAPYLVVAVAAAWRLPSPRLRALWVAMLCGWAAAGVLHGRPTDQRVDLEGVVAQMVEAERGAAGEVRVYACGWRVYSPIRFYLEQAGESRFRVVRVPDVSGVEGDHFWVAYPESRLEKTGDDPRAMLGELGYREGEPLVTGEPGSRVFLVPVWGGGRR